MMTDILSNKDKKKEIPWLQIIPILLGIITFLFGGGYFYNNVVNRQILTYTILPNYDLGNQFFNGVVIENRGRENQTVINMTISNLDSEITMLHFPGLHEPTDIITGGVGTKSVLINMPRLSAGKSLSVYFLTLKPIRLDDTNLFVSSSETVGQPSSQNISVFSTASILAAVITFLSAVFSVWYANSLRTTIAKRKEKEYVTMQELLKVIQSIQHLEKDSTELSVKTKELGDESKELGDRNKLLKAQQNELEQSFSQLDDEMKQSFSQLDNAKGELLKKIEFTSKSIGDLETAIRKTLELGELEPNERIEKILAILKQFQESIQKSEEIAETFPTETRIE